MFTNTGTAQPKPIEDHMRHTREIPPLNDKSAPVQHTAFTPNVFQTARQAFDANTTAGIAAITHSRLQSDTMASDQSVASTNPFMTSSTVVPKMFQQASPKQANVVNMHPKIGIISQPLNIKSRSLDLQPEYSAAVDRVNGIKTVIQPRVFANPAWKKACFHAKMTINKKVVQVVNTKSKVHETVEHVSPIYI